MFEFLGFGVLGMLGYRCIYIDMSIIHIYMDTQIRLVFSWPLAYYQDDDASDPLLPGPSDYGTELYFGSPNFTSLC